MFDFNKNGKMDFIEFAIGTGMFDADSPANKQNFTKSNILNYDLTQTTISNNSIEILESTKKVINNSIVKNI